jgi:cytoskeletal protein RodZ
LEASRNELLVATTIISIISSTIGFAGFVTGAFGMNLDNTRKLESIDGFFAWVITLCVLFVILVSSGVILYFEKSGWLPKHDYWENFKQLQNKATNLVAQTPLSQLNTLLEGVAATASAGISSATGGTTAAPPTPTSAPSQPTKVQQRKKTNNNKVERTAKSAATTQSAKTKTSTVSSSSFKHHAVPTTEDGIELIA